MLEARKLMPTLMRRFVCETLVFLLSAAIAQPTVVAVAEPQNRAGTLIEELRAATRNGREDERNSVIERLSEEGTNALPVVYEVMKTADVPLRINLVDVVRRMDVDESTEALLRFAYLRAFYFMNSALAVPALKRTFTATADENTRKWLTVALGMAGDESQSAALLEIVRDAEEDISTRAEALRAYARAAKAQAIPVLEGFLSDTTPGPDPIRPPLAVVARSELQWLRNPENRRQLLGK